MSRPENINKFSLVFVKDVLWLFAGFASMVMLGYGIGKTYIEAADGFFWIIPAGICLWLAFVWRLFLSRKLFAYILMGVTLASLLSGWVIWQRMDQLNANKFIVLVTKFDMQEDKYGIRDQLVQQVKGATAGLQNTGFILSNEMILAGNGNESAIKIGTREKADVVLWGWFRPAFNPNVSLNIMDFSPRTTTTPKKKDIFSHSETIITFDSIAVARNNESQTKTFGLFLAGIISSKQGDYASAIKLFEQILSEKDSTTFIPPYDIYFYLANAQAGSGHTDLAIEAYNKAALLYRKGAETYNNRGVVYASLGQNDLAIQNYTTAIQTNKNFSAAYSNRGNIYVDLKQFQPALADFNKAVGIDPNYAAGFYNRGNAFFAMGQYESAVQDYSRVITLDPNFFAAYFNRGTAYQKLDKIPEADADFKKYTSLTGNQP